MVRVLVRLGGFLLIAMLAVWLYALLDAITADRRLVRRLPKGAWIVLVLFTFEIGAVLWLVFGRPEERAAARVRGRGPVTRRLPGREQPRPRPLAPDDDPDFLRGLKPPRPPEDDPTD